MNFYFQKLKLRNSVCPILLIDNTYRTGVCEEIIEELNILIPEMLLPDLTGTAIDKGKNAILKRNKGKFIDHHDKLGRLVNSIFENREVVNKIEELDYLMFLQFKICDKSSILASYYENTDYYLPHEDRSVITSITWFNNSPKSFDGGDLILTETGLRITPQHNRTVFFLGALTHEVQEVMVTNKNTINPGRFSITKFYNH